MLNNIHLRAIVQHVPKLLFCIMSLKIIPLTLLPHFPGPSEVTLKVQEVLGDFVNCFEYIFWSAQTFLKSFTASLRWQWVKLLCSPHVKKAFYISWRKSFSLMVPQTCRLWLGFPCCSHCSSLVGWVCELKAIESEAGMSVEDCFQKTPHKMVTVNCL